MLALDRHLALRPAALFHYTDQAGLLGIWRSGELWASVAYYLNDAHEFHAGLDLARKILGEKMSASEDRISRALNLEKMHRNIGRIEQMNIFVCSFCEKGDLLSQWRGYGGRSSGYALDFDPNALEAVAGRDGYSLRKCIYDERLQGEIISDLVEQWASDADDLAEGFVRHLPQIAAMFKPAAFSEEQEWRLISGWEWGEESAKRLDFRTGPSTIVPMHRIRLTEGGNKYLPIKGVVVGPTPHMRLAGEAVSKLRHTLRGQGGYVTLSQTPYRTW